MKKLENLMTGLLIIGVAFLKVSRRRSRREQRENSYQYANGYYIVNCETLVINNLNQAKITAFEIGSKFESENISSLMNILIFNCFDLFSLTEPNIKNSYLLIFYALVGTYNSGKISIDKILEFLKIFINDFKINGVSVVKDPTTEDIKNAVQEIKNLKAKNI